MDRSIKGTFVEIVPFANAGAKGPDVDLLNGSTSKEPKMIVPIHRVVLLEQNRGKAGALNASLQYLKAKASQWCDQCKLDDTKIQVFLGIVDARHMLAEPDIFWNDALPFFSGLKVGSLSKDYGSNVAGPQLCINVQYPQYFSNVTRDDFLDNKNSAYYTVWQTLRDGAKATTSSGTNAIWYVPLHLIISYYVVFCYITICYIIYHVVFYYYSMSLTMCIRDVSNPSFEYATTSRIEDTGNDE